MKILVCQLVDEKLFLSCFVFKKFYKHSHVSNFHVDMVLFNVIFLQQDHEFQLLCAILCQDLVARQGHLVLVSPVVECGQYVSLEAAFS